MNKLSHLSDDECDHLIAALSVAIRAQSKLEEELRYRSESAWIASWKDIRKKLEPLHAQ